ncbi:hypothetical protein JCM11641_002658 [Rhodosporidiobolus odoratus]
MHAYEVQMNDACDLIKDTAPTRGNTGAGIMSQKQPDEVDNAWKRTVEGHCGKNGRLAAAGATYAKVSAQQGDRIPYTLWLWVEDASNVVAVETVFRIAVEQSGFAPASFKRILGMNLKHPSKIAVSTFAKTTSMTTAEIKQAIQEYQSKGPAASISPLSGPPPPVQIDWEFEYNPAQDQSAFRQAAEGSSSKVEQATPRKRKAPIEYDLPLPPVRGTRKAAQKARETISAAAVETQHHRTGPAAARRDEGPMSRLPSPSPAPKRQRLDEVQDVWNPEPEVFAGEGRKTVRFC